MLSKLSFFFLLVIVLGCGPEPPNSGYYPVLMENETALFQSRDWAWERSQDQVLSIDNTLVEFNDYGNLDWISILELEGRFFPSDPRNTPFLQKVPDLFYQEGNPKGSLLAFFPSSIPWQEVEGALQGIRFPEKNHSYGSWMPFWIYTIFFIGASLVFLIFIKHRIWLGVFVLLWGVAISTGGLGILPLALASVFVFQRSMEIIRDHHRGGKKQSILANLPISTKILLPTLTILGFWGWSLDSGPYGWIPGIIAWLLSLSLVGLYFFFQDWKQTKRLHNLFQPVRMISHKKKPNLNYLLIIPMVFLILIPFLLGSGSDGFSVPVANAPPDEQSMGTNPPTNFASEYFAHRFFQDHFMYFGEYRSDPWQYPMILREYSGSGSELVLSEENIPPPDEIWKSTIVDSLPKEAVGRLALLTFPFGWKNQWIAPMASSPIVLIILGLVLSGLGWGLMTRMMRRRKPSESRSRKRILLP